MKTITDIQFVELLRQRRIVLSVKDDRLHISAPTGAVDAELRAELIRRKPALLALFRKLKTPISPIVQRAKDEKIPQTPIQQGLWLINHYQPDNVSYNIPEAFLIEDLIDIGILREVVHQLVERHEILRTSFHEVDGELLQVVAAEAEASTGFTDLSQHPEAERRHIVQSTIRELARQPFDLKIPPLVRFHLFCLDRHQSIFFLNIHHIIADRQSINILYEESIALYRAKVKNEIANLPTLTVQYPDYALWAANEIDPVMLEGQLKYWKRKLAGMPPFLDLPHSRPYPALRTSWGAALPLEIPDNLQVALKQLGHEDGTTPFLVFLAMFALLLYIYSGSEDFCIGSPITLRKQDETERMVGVFVNMLAFRCQLTPEMSFREFLKQIRQTAVEAYDNSDLPFQKLVSAFKPDRRSQRSPIFQVLFGFESSAQRTGSAFQIDTEAGTARYDLTLNVVDTADKTFASFEYCTDLFDVTDIEEICKGLSVIQKMVLYPDQELSQFITPGLQVETDVVI